MLRRGWLVVALLGLKVPSQNITRKTLDCIIEGVRSHNCEIIIGSGLQPSQTSGCQGRSDLENPLLYCCRVRAGKLTHTSFPPARCHL